MERIISFLRKTRFRTINKKKADNSIFVWGLSDDKQEFTLSLLGIINGFLSFIRLQLIAMGPRNKYTKLKLIRKRY